MRVRSRNYPKIAQHFRLVNYNCFCYYYTITIIIIIPITTVLIIVLLLLLLLSLPLSFLLLLLFTWIDDLMASDLHLRKIRQASDHRFIGWECGEDEAAAFHPWIATIFSVDTQE